MATAAAGFKKREAKWRRVVRGHAGSGMSVRAYCANVGVSDHAFYWWRRELARREAAKPKAAFVPVVVRAPAAREAEGMSIELRGGRMLRLPVMPAAQVAELVRAIEGAA